METLYRQTEDYTITSFQIGFQDISNITPIPQPQITQKQTEPESLKDRIYSTGILIFFSSTLLFAIVNSDKIFTYWDKFQNSLIPPTTLGGERDVPFTPRTILPTAKNCPQIIYPHLPGKRFTLTGQEIPEHEELNQCSRY